MPTSVRLDPESEALVARVARLRGMTKSQVIREALGALAEREGVAEKPYDALAQWIGCVDSGGLNRSHETGRLFRQILAGRRDARRSR